MNDTFSLDGIGSESNIHNNNDKNTTTSKGVGGEVEQLRSSLLPLCTPDDELSQNHKGRWVQEICPNITQCPKPM